MLGSGDLRERAAALRGLLGLPGRADSVAAALLEVRDGRGLLSQVILDER